MQRIEDLGGAVAAIEQGFQKSEIERSRLRDRAGDRLPASGSWSASTGSRSTTEEPYEPLRVDPAIEAEQAERLAKLRADRDGAVVEAALTRLQAAARGTDNVLYPMRDALAARATVGEVCDALREVWGTYVPVDAF